MSGPVTRHRQAIGSVAARLIRFAPPITACFVGGVAYRGRVESPFFRRAW